MARRMSRVAVSADVAADHQRAVLDVIGGMQHEAAAGLDRAAEMHLRAACRAGGVDAELAASASGKVSASSSC